MKISDEEVRAAAEFIWDSPVTPIGANIIRAALNAAYTVRKARKAAKRAGTAQGSKHQFAVGDFVLHSQRGHGQITSISTETNFELTPYIVLFTAEFKSYPCSGKHLTFIDAPEPAKPSWNGKFEVGKSYRTRDGQKAKITRLGKGPYPFLGSVGNGSFTWADNGQQFVGFEQSRYDLIAPWEGEK